MKIIGYLKESFRLTAMIFFILVAVNLLGNKETLFDVIESMMGIATISGLLHFILIDKEIYSTRRILLNQMLYIGIVFAQIVFCNQLYHWELGFSGLVETLILVIIIFAFIKFVMYSNDKKTAAEMNQKIKERGKR